MRLTLPDPRDLPRALLSVPDQLFGRVVGLLDAAEGVVGRVDELLSRIEATRQDAEAVVRRADVVAARAEPLVRRATEMLDRFEPPLTRLEPTLRTLAETTSPDEVAALTRMADHLPEVVTRLEDDLLPVMATMSTVAPDLHELLDASRELNEMLGKLPGMGRIRKRVEQEQEDDGPQDADRD